MDATLILTLVGTIFALYTVLPKHKQIRIGYAFGPYQIIKISILAFLLIVFLIGGIYVSLNYGNDYPNNYLFLFGINVQFVFELLYILTALFIFGWISYILVIPEEVEIKNISYLIGKIDELYNNKNYSALIALLDENYNEIFGESEIEEEKEIEDEDLVDALFRKISEEG